MGWYSVYVALMAFNGVAEAAVRALVPKRLVCPVRTPHSLRHIGHLCFRRIYQTSSSKAEELPCLPWSAYPLPLHPHPRMPGFWLVLLLGVACVVPIWYGESYLMTPATGYPTPPRTRRRPAEARGRGHSSCWHDCWRNPKRTSPRRLDLFAQCNHETTPARRRLNALPQSTSQPYRAPRPSLSLACLREAWWPNDPCGLACPHLPLHGQIRPHNFIFEIEIASMAKGPQNVSPRRRHIAALPPHALPDTGSPPAAFAAIRAPTSKPCDWHVTNFALLISKCQLCCVERARQTICLVAI